MIVRKRDGGVGGAGWFAAWLLLVGIGVSPVVRAQDTATAAPEPSAAAPDDAAPDAAAPAPRPPRAEQPSGVTLSAPGVEADASAPANPETATPESIPATVKVIVIDADAERKAAAAAAAAVPPPPTYEAWFIELGPSVIWRAEDDNDDTLEGLGTRTQVGRMLHPRFGVGLAYGTLGTAKYLGKNRGEDTVDYAFRTWAAILRPRVRLVQTADQVWSLDAVAGTGLGMAIRRHRDARGQRVTEQRFGPVWEAAMVLSALLHIPQTDIDAGAFVQAGYLLAPIVRNNAGQALNSGGPTVSFGLRLRTRE